MNEKISQVKNNVNDLSSFFSIFKRKKIKEDIFLKLNEIENHLNELEESISKLIIIKKEKEGLERNFNNLKKEALRVLTQKDLEIKEIKEKFNYKYVSDINLELENLKQELENDKSQIFILENTINKLKEEKKLELENLNNELEKEKLKIGKLEKNIKELKQKEHLISSLLLQESKKEILQEFTKILENDFYQFISKGYAVNIFELLEKFQSIEKELELISIYPDLYKKNIISVGGGFSAGKSEFISSFLNSNIKLSININPTTAIPTYVVNSEDDLIMGCSYKGEIIDFHKIDENLHLKLSHDFIKSFNFNLKKLMPFMIIATKMKFKNISFIDTPGYNPSNKKDSHTKEDKSIAKQFLDNPATMLWLIGADSNGTISESDLEFLSNLNLENKKVYVICNKADLRSIDDIEDILDEIEETLEDEDIEFEGISAYSSTVRQEYSYRNKPLFEFLKENDKEGENKIYDNIFDTLFDIYAVYRDAIEKEIEKEQFFYHNTHSISLDLIKEGCDDVSNDIFSNIKKLRDTFEKFKLKKENDLKELENIFEKFIKFINNVFEKRYSKSFKDIYINNNIIKLTFDLENNK
jgi:GTP-binding protein EngB required for normal cell division